MFFCLQSQEHKISKNEFGLLTHLFIELIFIPSCWNFGRKYLLKSSALSTRNVRRLRESHAKTQKPIQPFFSEKIEKKNWLTFLKLSSNLNRFFFFNFPDSFKRTYEGSRRRGVMYIQFICKHSIFSGNIRKSEQIQIYFLVHFFSVWLKISPKNMLKFIRVCKSHNMWTLCWNMQLSFKLKTIEKN